MYGAVSPPATTRGGPLPVQWNSRKTLVSVGLATMLVALSLVALAQEQDDQFFSRLPHRERQSILLAARGSSALAEKGGNNNIDQDVAAAQQQAQIALAAEKSQSLTDSIDTNLQEAQKQAQIAINAAGPVDTVDSFAAEAKKQASIASAIADSMDQAGSSTTIDQDVAAAQAGMVAAQKAAEGAAPADYSTAAQKYARIAIAAAAGDENVDPQANEDYLAEAKADLAIAQKNSPHPLLDSAAYAEQEAKIAIRDAGMGGGLEEANAEKAIAVAAAHGESDYVSAARRAADDAMEQAELTGKDVDYAAEARKELAIAVAAAGLQMPKLNDGASSGAASAAAAASGAAAAGAASGAAAAGAASGAAVAGAASGAVSASS